MSPFLHVIYDGDCAFCARSLNALAAIDLRGCFKRHDARQRDEVLARFPQLAGADLGDAMFLVDSAGDIHRGYFAFKRLLRSLPIAWPLLVLFYIPGADLAGPRVYAWVARNRRRFGCTADVYETPTRPKSH